MIYIASPYSHDNEKIRQKRYDEVCAYTAALIKEKHYAYSPVVHNHPLAVKFDLPKDFNFWEKFDKHMLKHSNIMHVLMLSGWKKSKGVQAEIEFAKLIDLPILYIK